MPAAVLALCPLLGTPGHYRALFLMADLSRLGGAGVQRGLDQVDQSQHASRGECWQMLANAFPMYIQTPHGSPIELTLACPSQSGRSKQALELLWVTSPSPELAVISIH